MTLLTRISLPSILVGVLLGAFALMPLVGEAATVDTSIADNHTSGGSSSGGSCSSCGGGSSGGSSGGGSSGGGPSVNTDVADSLIESGGTSASGCSTCGGSSGGGGSSIDASAASITNSSTLNETINAINSGSGNLTGFQDPAVAQSVADRMNANNPNSDQQAVVNTNGGLLGSHGVGMQYVGGGGGGSSSSGSYSGGSTGGGVSSGSGKGGSSFNSVYTSSYTSSYNPPIQGTCGSADGSTTYTSAPSSGLCSSGGATSVTGDRADGWSWSCVGDYGGGTDSCSTVGMCNASHASYPDPTVNLTAEFVDGDAWGNAVTEAAPGDRIRLSWDEGWSNAGTGSFSTRSCSGTGFSNGDIITAGEEMDLGGTRSYSVQCSENLCDTSTNDSVQVGVANPTISDLSADSDIIRSGETATINWTIEADGRTPFAMSCSLAGATAYDFKAEDEPTGSVETDPLTNFFTNRLRCTEPVTGSSIEAESEIEVVPGAQEL